MSTQIHTKKHLHQAKGKKGEKEVRSHTSITIQYFSKTSVHQRQKIFSTAKEEMTNNLVFRFDNGVLSSTNSKQKAMK